VSCPTLPGCHSLGYREKDALENIKEAIEGCMQSLAEERMKTSAPGWVVEVTV
jgi:predicted RNase H-like HicB family nuclease